MSTIKHRMVKDITTYVPVRIVSLFIKLFTSIVLKRFLGPTYAGIWSMIRVIASYVSFANLGINSAITYNVTYCNGKGEYKKAEHIKKLVFSFFMAVGAVASIGLIFYSLIFSGKLGKEMFYGLIALAFAIVFERIYSYYTAILKADKNYNVLSRSVLLDCVFNLVLILVIVSRWKLYGVYIVSILLPILNIAYLLIKKVYLPKFKLDIKDSLHYVKLNFSIFVSSVLYTLLDSVDRIMITIFLGFTELGYYSLGLMIKGYCSYLRVSLNHVVTIYFMEYAGEHGEHGRLKDFMLKGLLSMSTFMALVLSIIYIVADPLINSILPSFRPGINVFKIFLLTSLMANLFNFPRNYIVAIKKQKHLILFICVALIINICCNYFFIISGYGITGVAWATFISNTLFFLCLYFFSTKTFMGYFASFATLLKTFFPLLYSICVIMLFERFVQDHNLISRTIIMLAGYLLCSLVPLYILERETGIVILFFNNILEKIRIKPEGNGKQ